jgi:hypothetical protein
MRLVILKFIHDFYGENTGTARTDMELFYDFHVRYKSDGDEYEGRVRDEFKRYFKDKDIPPHIKLGALSSCEYFLKSDKGPLNTKEEADLQKAFKADFDMIKGLIRECAEPAKREKNPPERIGLLCMAFSTEFPSVLKSVNANLIEESLTTFSAIQLSVLFNFLEIDGRVYTFTTLADADRIAYSMEYIFFIERIQKSVTQYLSYFRGANVDRESFLQSFRISMSIALAGFDDNEMNKRFRLNYKPADIPGDGSDDSTFLDRVRYFADMTSDGFRELERGIGEMDMSELPSRLDEIASVQCMTLMTASEVWRNMGETFASSMELTTKLLKVVKDDERNLLSDKPDVLTALLTKYTGTMQMVEFQKKFGDSLLENYRLNAKSYESKEYENKSLFDAYTRNDPTSKSVILRLLSGMFYSFACAYACGAKMTVDKREFEKLIERVEGEYSSTCRYYDNHQHILYKSLCKNLERLSLHREKYKLPETAEITRLIGEWTAASRQLDVIKLKLASNMKRIRDTIGDEMSPDLGVGVGIRLDPNFNEHNKSLESILERLEDAIGSSDHEEISGIDISLLNDLRREENKGPNASLKTRLQVSNDLFHVLYQLITGHDRALSETTKHAMAYRAIAQDQYLKYQRVMKFFGGFYDFPESALDSPVPKVIYDRSSRSEAGDDASSFADSSERGGRGSSAGGGVESDDSDDDVTPPVAPGDGAAGGKGGPSSGTLPFAAAEPPAAEKKKKKKKSKK